MEQIQQNDYSLKGLLNNFKNDAVARFKSDPSMKQVVFIYLIVFLFILSAHYLWTMTTHKNVITFMTVLKYFYYYLPNIILTFGIFSALAVRSVLIRVIDSGTATMASIVVAMAFLMPSIFFWILI